MNHIQPVLNSDEIARMITRINNFVGHTEGGRFTLLRVPDWTAVPVQSSSHLCEADQERLIRAFQNSGQRWVWAVALEPLHNATLVFRIPVSSQGLQEFNRECSHFNYAVFAEDESSLVICTTDDYFVVAGNPTFVSEAVGRSEAEAIEAFRQFAQDPSWTEKAAAFFDSVLQAITEDYGAAAPGERVRFPR
jgi:hypothetical protein